MAVSHDPVPASKPGVECGDGARIVEGSERMTNEGHWPTMELT